MSRFLLGLRRRILIFSRKRVVCSPGVEGERHFGGKAGTLKEGFLNGQVIVI